MTDVQDILGVSRSGANNDKPEQKEKKEKVKRPEGMSREAFALLGGVHPLIPSHIADGLKRQADAQQKPKASTKGVITYQFKPFRNQGRKDHLQLSHWVKGYKDASGRIRDAEEGDYSFAKFNKQVRGRVTNHDRVHLQVETPHPLPHAAQAQVYRYDEEEWNSLLCNDTTGWSREETDYLLDVCETFDLRFPVIVDRYDVRVKSQCHTRLQHR
jgi:DNA methyltransferase 1-associated protein 1